MANIGAYSRHRFLEELEEPLDSLEGVLSPAAQRLRVLQNLSGDTDATLANFIGAVTGEAPSSSVGTANTGVTATEYGTAGQHTTVLSFTDLVVGAAGDSGAQGRGVLLYTLPAGIIQVKSAVLSVGLTLAGGATPTTDTPDLGLGTVIATGSISVLSGTATFEDILTGQTVNDMAGTVEFASVAQNLGIAAASAHTVHLNVADTWADLTPNNPNILATGTVAISWDRITTS